MDWQRNPQLEDELLSQMQLAMQDDDRHQPSVSGMIYCLTKTYYENELTLPNSDGTRTSPHTRSTQLLFATGLWLEKVVLSGRQVSEGGEYNGIQWHLDHYGTANGFIEFKSTRARPNKNETLPYTSEGWLKQIKAYCKVKGITEGDLTILHLMGNYSPPFPELMSWHFTLTQQEIDDNWDWIEGRATIYREHIAKGEPPSPFKYNEDWECTNCYWLNLCKTRERAG